MLSLLRAPSRSAGNSILYVTVGVLAVIWSGIWYYAISGEEMNWQHYVCIGLMLSGIAVTIIGLLFGQIGGAAKEADNTVGVAPAAPMMVQPGAVMQPGMVQPGMVQPGMMQPGAVAQPGQPYVQ